MSITIYTQPGCGRCKVLKQKLEAKGIEYAESQNVDEMRKLGVDTLPAVLIDNELMTFEKAVKFINER